MKQLVKALLSAAIVALAAALVRSWCVEPVRCTQLELPLQVDTRRAIDQDQSPLARDTLEKAARALRSCPGNVNMHMIAAANLRQLGRNWDAIRVYEEALAYDHRPEIYLNIGQTRLEANMAGRAVDDYARAVSFAPSMIDDVPAQVRGEVTRRAAAEFAGATIRNGDFRMRSPRGAREYHGAGPVGISAALDWTVYIGNAGTTRTELVPSARRPGHPMLHVVTNERGSGVGQQWAPTGLGLTRAETDLWIFVRRGVVRISSGNVANVVDDAYTKTSGQWEHIVAETHSCPVNFTLIVAATGGGADFDLDTVRVDAVPGECGP